MQNEITRIQKRTPIENIFTECNEDFILPDYLPEIRRILRLESRPVRGGCFMGSGKADFEGRMLYTLFYTDTEEKLTAVPLESRYEYHLPLSCELPSDIRAIETVEGINMRPSGPRRINIRTKLRSKVQCLCEGVLQKAPEELLPSAHGEAEFLVQEKKILRECIAQSEVTEAEAEWKLDGAQEEDIRLLYGNADVLCESAHAENGHILARGTVCLRLMLEKEGEVFTLIKRVPFEEEIAAEGCRAMDLVTASAACHAVEVSTEEDAGGVTVRALASFVIHAEAKRNETVFPVTDLYTSEQVLSVTAKPQRLTALADSFMGNFSIENESEAKESEQVLLTSLSVKDCSVTLLGKRAVFSGEMCADLLCQEKTDEKEPFSSVEHTFSFRLEAELSENCTENDIPVFTLTPFGAETVTQNGKHYTTAELGVCLSVLREEEVALPDAVSAMPREKSGESDTLTIYYPTDKDSLWSVGKLYGIPTEILQKQNGMAQESDTPKESGKSLDGMAWLITSRLA